MTTTVSGGVALSFLTLGTENNDKNIGKGYKQAFGTVTI